MKPRLVVLTGAGISAESGISTFRDANGLWEGHRIEDVASPEGWKRNPEKVLEFYNLRRKQLGEVVPNLAHHILKKLEDHFEVYVITQNVDDLHERAGSSNIVHLHGQLRQVRSSTHEEVIYDIAYGELKIGDMCETTGSQLRPNIVWFGEQVPMMDSAIEITLQSDIFLVIGTSLEVYPAASLLNFVPYGKPVYIIDPNRHENRSGSNVVAISKKATEGMMDLYVNLTGRRFDDQDN